MKLLYGLLVSDTATIATSSGGTAGTRCVHVQGLLFSHGTDKLVAVNDNAADYLGSLDSELTRYSALFEDATDLPQPDIHGGTVLVRPNLSLGLS